MPRINRVSEGGVIYHCINRSSGHTPIFHDEKEFQRFEDLLQEGVELTGMRILAYCIMPNHWHLLLYPQNKGDMGEFMRWLTTTHARQYRTRTETVGHGHLYQGTYKSFPVETDRYFIQLMVYIEQNPLRAKLVHKAEDWQWSSLWRREKGTEKQRTFLSELPTPLPKNYLKVVNTLPPQEHLETIRHSVNKGLPFGSDMWVEDMIKTYNLKSTTRGPGRPKNSN